jgi:hypothetical protein
MGMKLDAFHTYWHKLDTFNRITLHTFSVIVCN